MTFLVEIFLFWSDPYLNKNAAIRKQLKKIAQILMNIAIQPVSVQTVNDIFGRDFSGSEFVRLKKKDIANNSE